MKLHDNTGVSSTTSNAAVATVTSQGVVRGVKPGTATIRSYSGGVLRASVNVTVLPKHTHSLTYVPAKAASCVAGNKAYYKCSCGKLFTDSKGTNETTLAAVTLAATGSHVWSITPAVSPTYTSYGYTLGVKCTKCGAVQLERKLIPMLTRNSSSSAGSTSSSSAAAKAPAAAVSSAVSSGSSGTYPTGGTYAATYPAAVQTGVVKTVLSKTDYTYSGKAKKPKVTVYYNGAKLAKKYYSVKYYSNKKPGIATVVITGKGSYKGKFNCTRTFVIRPAKVKIKTPVAGKGYLKVKWKKRPGCSGYEISVADNRNFNNARTVRINASSVKVTSLVRGRKYYCRVRAYKVVQNKALYGSWSKIKVKKVK